MIRHMLLSLAYSLARFLAEVCLVRARSDAQLRAEVLALRHQVRVLERKLGKPRWQPGERLLLAALSRLLPKSAWSALLPSPETLLRWHRDLVRRKWAAYRRCPRRPRQLRDPELRDLILRGELIRGALDRDRTPRAARSPSIFGHSHLEAVLQEFLVHYHRARPHQGLDQRLSGSCSSPWTSITGGRIVRHDRLGGLLHEYFRAG
jgi:hypothetical protein